MKLCNMHNIEKKYWLKYMVCLHLIKNVVLLIEIKCKNNKADVGALC